MLTSYLTLVVCHIDLTSSKGLLVIYRISYVKDGMDFLIKLGAGNTEICIYGSIIAAERVIPKSCLSINTGKKDIFAFLSE